MKFEIRETYNPYVRANKYVVTRKGWSLLPPEQHGAYDTLEEAKEYIQKVKSTGGLVWSE